MPLETAGHAAKNAPKRRMRPRPVALKWVLSYKGDSPLAAWLWRIAINCMMDHFRRTKARPADNLNDDEWAALEQNSDAMRTVDPPPENESLEDCVQRGFAEFAKKSSDRAYVLSLVMEGFDTAHIAAAIQRTPGATREFISQSRKRIEEFLLPCKEYLSAA
jgi:RNA polymerase sigma-70 factor (ECF subfamily)